MPALVVGGVAISIAPGGVKRDRNDAVDRRRAFDNTYRASSTGNPKHDFHFSTPPIPRATSDTYETTLATVTAQTCSGDILGTSMSCCSEITGWTPVLVKGGHRVVLEFILHEV